MGGVYSFPSVSPGIYTLQVIAPNFAKYEISRFNVTVGQRATENATLGVASATQTVTVNAGDLANLLDPESNDLGTVIGPETVSQIPLNGRNFLQLGLLSGATQQNGGAAGSSVSQTGSNGTNGNRLLSLLVAGNEPDFTMYLVNGIQTIGITPQYVLGKNIWGPTTVGQISAPQVAGITGPIQYLSQTQRSPYIYQYNLDVERTFGPYLLDVAYIGNVSHRLAVNYNPFDCSAADFTCDNTRIPYGGKYPYMQDVDSIGWGNYNGSTPSVYGASSSMPSITPTLQTRTPASTF